VAGEYGATSLMSCCGLKAARERRSTGKGQVAELRVAESGEARERAGARRSTQSAQPRNRSAGVATRLTFCGNDNSMPPPGQR
jgi:hypothetical protein